MTTPTTPEGRRELKALAEKATPGPWKADGTIYEHMVAEIRSIMPGEERGIAQVWQHPQGFADARFIAAANPATVLSLLASLEEAEGRLDEHALFDAETDVAFKDLDATIDDLKEHVATITRERDEALTKNRALGFDLQTAWATLETAEVLADVATRIGEFAADIRRSAATLSRQSKEGGE